MRIIDAVGRMGFPWFVAAPAESTFSQDRIAYADLPSSGEEVPA
jgi:hypothetical protein